VMDNWRLPRASKFESPMARPQSFQRVGRHRVFEEDSSSLPSKVSYRPCARSGP